MLKKRCKIWMSLGVGSLILLGLGLGWADRFFDRILQRAIETSATRALGTEVTLGGLQLRLTKGVLTFTDLEIANPPGYHSQRLLILERGTIHLKTLSLMSKRVEMTSVQLDHIQLLWEQQGRDNNLQDFLDQLPTRNKQHPPSRPLFIEVLDVTRAEVKAPLGASNRQESELVLQLNPIRLTDLGAQEDLGLGVLTRRIASALVTCTLEQGSEVFSQGLVSPLRNTWDAGLNLWRKAVDLGRDIHQHLETQQQESGVTVTDAQ